MKRIFLTMIVAVAFTAAAQTYDYGVLTIRWAQIDSSATAVSWETSKQLYTGPTLHVIANQIVPEPRYQEMGLGGLLDVIGDFRWKLHTTLHEGGVWVLIFERANQ